MVTWWTPSPLERVEVRGQRRDQRLALTGLHLRDPAEVQRRAAHQLHVEVTLAEDPLAGLADGGERLGEQVVEVLAPLEAPAELGGLGAELVVGEALHVGLERADLGDDRLQQLEFPALAHVEDPFEEAHCGPSYRRGRPKSGPFGRRDARAGRRRPGGLSRRLGRVRRRRTGMTGPGPVDPLVVDPGRAGGRPCRRRGRARSGRRAPAACAFTRLRVRCTVTSHSLRVGDPRVA